MRSRGVSETGGRIGKNRFTPLSVSGKEARGPGSTLPFLKSLFQSAFSSFLAFAPGRSLRGFGFSEIDGAGGHGVLRFHPYREPFSTRAAEPVPPARTGPRALGVASAAPGAGSAAL